MHIYVARGGDKLRLLGRIEKLLAAILIVAGALLGFATIILRYAFGITFPWTEGIVVMLTVWGALLAGAVAIQDGSHLSVDVLVERLPKRYRKVMSVFRYAMVALLAITLLLLGVNYWIFLFQSGSRSLVTYLPNWVPFTGLLVALFFLAVHSSYCAIRAVNEPVRD